MSRSKERRSNLCLKVHLGSSIVSDLREQHWWKRSQCIDDFSPCSEYQSMVHTHSLSSAVWVTRGNCNSEFFSHSWAAKSTCTCLLKSQWNKSRLVFSVRWALPVPSSLPNAHVYGRSWFMHQRTIQHEGKCLWFLHSPLGLPPTGKWPGYETPEAVGWAALLLRAFIWQTRLSLESPKTHIHHSEEETEHNPFSKMGPVYLCISVCACVFNDFETLCKSWCVVGLWDHRVTK